ncbi:MAG: hypothetical protein A2287_05075 [Candidatus Melainabacteria bacterium RIFOXYA12_FULL_32_12]|nr:MAG: hypothetical protein A2104_05795 [Candidatus Melainabacteria bacterium GWF2_32_7]OGI21808.1 MAG: hypothetical protein A2255_00625 [Candidatus Melainabacteria bacterium RIFOXYA2_FULL_32_9]OGI28866.1 MAG: hypothetical protein A2287_05075 [Candidatus Melainabacteria bacterium RIFOXYA12_FULL_32_12]
MSKKSVILTTVIGILSILGFLAFNISSNITRDINLLSDESNNDSKRANIEELVITETREGQKFWEVYATSGQYSDNKNMAVLTNIKGNFYKEGKVVLSFDAPVATYISRNKEIRLSGGSRAATNNDILITSKELTWTGGKDEILAKGNVKIKKSDELIITSDKSSFNTDFTYLKLMGNSETNVYKKN